jgi:nucleotide-binding universal stress UspA family protein
VPDPSIAVPARPEHVLVCTDGSAEMLAAAQGGALIARQLGAELRLVHVQTGDSEREQERAGNVSARAADLGATAEILRSDGGTGGEVAGTLSRHLDRLPGALVVLSTHGRGAIGQSIFGSVTADVVRARPRPFLVFGPRAAAPEGFSRLLVCTDGSELSEAILPAATGLARDLRLPTWVVEVLEPVPGSGPGGDLTETATVQRVAGLIEQGAAAGSPTVEWEVLHGGHAGGAIAEYADGTPGTITALATHGRGGLAGKLAGSVAHEVTRRVSGPVLLLRPGDTNGR